MHNFRLVILDYAKLHLDNPATQKALNDLIVIKQKNFERTDPNYVVMDKHDMIGTHFMIYDNLDIFSPKLIFAIRVTYEDRAELHRLKTPLQDLIPNLDLPTQKIFMEYHIKHPILADCNSWFVDPEYSLKNSGLRLSDIGYTMIYLHLTRVGFDHIAGCTNEKVKASRWLENIGTFQKGHIFLHPIVPDPHMLILIEKFNHTYMQSIYLDNKYLFDNINELVLRNEKYKNINEAIKKSFGNEIPAELKKVG